MASISKNEKIIENMKAVSVNDVNVDLKIPRSATPFDETKHKFKCTACGKGYT